MNDSLPLDELALVLSGVATERRGANARVVMVGDLDGTGRLPSHLTKVGPPKNGLDAQLQLGDVVISLRGNSNHCAVVTTAAVGIANMWLAVFADVGVAILAILNAMRCMNVGGLRK